jgi:parallel beta-helix repeat protein
MSMHRLAARGLFLLASAALMAGPARAANNSQLISQSVPSSLHTNETATVSVTFKNTGTTTWTQAGGFKLGTQNPQDNTIWTGGTRIYLGASDSIAPNQQKTFTFTITAPATPGTYNFQWRMVQEGVQWFGAFSTNVAVQVTTAPPNDAAFVSQSVPATLATGQSQTVSVTMKNTGTNTWTSSNYKLGTQSPQDNTRWTGDTRAYMSPGETVAPGQQKTFTFTITAPVNAGTYDFQWRMVDEGVEWFGALTPKVVITVSPGGGCAAANPNDSAVDDSPLQCLLNGGGRIELAPGSPGYVVGQGLNLAQNGTYLTSSNAPTKATLLAGTSLAAPILSVNDKSSFTLESLLFDGNKTARRGGVVTCQGYRIAGTNVAIGGSTSSGFVLRSIESSRALCGTSLQIHGSSFEVADSTFNDNGSATPNFSGEEPWADGITTGLCAGGWIHGNTITNATDVGIVDGGGANCTIENNTIRQTSAHAFAGLAVHNFALEGNGNHAGSIFQSNTITSGLNLLDFGISVGIHPWDASLATSGGTVRFNTVSGARVNLAVDGYSNGTVDGNTLSSPQGSLGGCGATNYSVGHTTGSCLQCGWTVRSWHGFTCQSTGETIGSSCHVC